MNLTYITPRSLGFNEPSTYTDILKIVGKTRKDLGLCPEETGLVLAGMMLGLDLDRDSNNYYVMSERHQDDLASDFLKIERNGEERIMLSGFSEKTIIGVDDFLVFQGVQDRVDLTNY